ncbi:hypothetical protein PBI_THONKO_78 [Mycobacterium phage Thonko]|uniref:Uncharacterized protein n=1 Tax=Mycobacterium phage Thonko TaxID=2282910 RepID=A0A346FCC4_9CAUD|nr:hypothetical protein I5G57_gp078 [Mycobacterium phage Thonko]AXN53349.1 hypothetical protein PBI_THONKO_78 [Mycobacterium phage Thonko]
MWSDPDHDIAADLAAAWDSANVQAQHLAVVAEGHRLNAAVDALLTSVGGQTLTVAEARERLHALMGIG